MLCLLYYAPLLFVTTEGAPHFRQDASQSGFNTAFISNTGDISSLHHRPEFLQRHMPVMSQISNSGTLPGTFNVRSFGAAGDGTTDDTQAFTEAIAAAKEAGGGHVYAPPGQYLFRGNLTIPGGVTVKGSYQVVPSHDLRTARWRNLTLDDGSILIPTQGRGAVCDLDCHDFFIWVQENAVLQGFTVLYAEQERQDMPVPYPWTIFMSGNNAAVMDVELLGSWNGISAVGAHRHYIARVQGQPINIGVFVDETYDIGRLEDIHFNPWFSSSKPFVHHQTTHGRAFVMGRSDWEYVFNTFAFAYAIGYHFIERGTGSMNGNFLGIGMDLATNASVQVDQSQPYGILITNGEFTAFCDEKFCPGPNVSTFPRQVVVSSTNSGAVKFVNSAFWGPSAQIAKTDGIGTVTFSQCHFDSWDNNLSPDGSSYVQNGNPAIQQDGGTLIVTMNEFVGTLNNPVHLETGQNANKTIFTNNIIKGKLGLNNTGTGKVVVANNADDSDGYNLKMLI